MMGCMFVFPSLDIQVRLHKRLPREFRPHRRLQFRVVIWLGWGVLAAFVAIALFSYFTNPFVTLSLVRDEIAVQVIDGEQRVTDGSSPIVRDNRAARTLAFGKSAYHMISTLVGGGESIPGLTVDEIIASIHARRFSPSLPFLISGDHFSMIYPRSLGIFYHSLLDPRTSLGTQDWEHRQSMYLKTLTFALAVYSETNQLSTTIVPLGPQGVVLINVYAPPSDTLYSLLYALKILRSSDELIARYPFASTTPAPTVKTDQASRELLSKYQSTLQRHYQTYWTQVYDPVTGLVRRDIILSGTKDSVKRHAAFYDNVMLWKTTQLAGELNLIERDDAWLSSLKERILATFWDDQSGYFIEELGTLEEPKHAYSSDWLIAYQTGMLSADDPADRPYLERSVAYIQSQDLDQPFGLRFSNTSDTSDYYWPVKYGTPNYVTTAIWSHWGMEYAKLLTHLALVTRQELYLADAEHQIDAYTANIIRYQGFPEVYSSDGKIYENRFYRSVRATGWVVNFEQARAMVRAAKNGWAETK